MLELSKIYRGCKKGGTPSLTKHWHVEYKLNGDRKQVTGGSTTAKQLRSGRRQQRS